MDRALVWTAALLCGAGAAGCGRQPPSSTTNVVLIVVDTLRADAISDPEGRIATPNIDSLAADGVLFEQAFAHAPMTLPAHTSLFSSKPPFETGVLNNGQRVPRDIPLLAEWMEEHGYRTEAVISLGTLSPVAKAGLDRGFDRFDQDFWQITPAEEVIQRLRRTVDDLRQPFLLFAHFSDPHEPYDAHGTDDHRAALAIDGEHVADLSTSDLTIWDEERSFDGGEHTLELSSEDPFIVSSLEIRRGSKRVEPTWELGQPLVPGERVRIRFDARGKCRIRFRINDRVGQDEIRRRYALEVEHVDRYVGELIDMLRERHLYDSTVIAFTSDHGEALGEHGMVGHVQNLYDEMLAVPLIVKPALGDPRLADLERARTALATHADLTPTLLELADLPPLPEQRGASVLELQGRILIAQTHRPQAKRDLLCLRDEAFKMIYDPEADVFTMFDLTLDPAESSDVFAARVGERPLWPDQLRALADMSRPAADDGDALVDDREREEMLRALGY